MDSIEELMAQYPYLNFIFDCQMPKKQKGLYIDGTVYLNPDQGKSELLETLSEEIAHYESTVGEIYLEDTHEKKKMEKQARNKALEKVVTLDVLIECFEKGDRQYWEVAERLDVTPEFVHKALMNYKVKYGDFFDYKGYSFKFNKGDTLDILR